MNPVIISQARMTSSRLPGKVLKEINSQPILSYHVSRLEKSGLPIRVATTTNNTDRPIIDWCLANDISYSRGDEKDVLSRYYYAAKEAGADTVIRVTSDCPLIDGELIRKGLEEYQAAERTNLFYSNTYVRSFPRGFDFAIFSIEMLEDAFKNAKEQSDREHVTPYFRNKVPGDIFFKTMRSKEDRSSIRITLDESMDFTLIQVLIEEYEAHKLSYDGIMKLIDEHPKLLAINKKVAQKG